MTDSAGFDAALRQLQDALDHLATATIRARNIEFPSVDFTSPEPEPDADPGRTGDELADLRRWATDENARNAEFRRRVDEAFDAEIDGRGGWLTDERRTQIIEDVRANLLAQLRRFGGV
ncbi:hypothetical protein [Gordonia hankookensis]|uniref:Uncharacterized protein n=1 Tax=Gordonia hankookensis TaxID=589403 RepID=A0ABR7WCM3_9ACTN|nr:hypothetical protein [Gordonia hankookensis]MBD1320546.1 hypothetical protein [Gordonia hankookensis]